MAVDQAEAMKYFRQAAEKGLAEAPTSLGVCYFKGAGVEVNKAEAAEFFRRAAMKGHRDSAGDSN